MKNILKTGLLFAMVCGLVACQQQDHKKKKDHHPRKTSMVSQQADAMAPAEVSQESQQ